MIRRRRVAAAGGLVALALTIPVSPGGPLAAQLVAAAGKPATPPASSPPPKSLQVTGPTSFAPGITPGNGSHTFYVTVGNPAKDTGVVTIASVTAEVTSVRQNGVPSSCLVVVDSPTAQADGKDILIRSYTRPPGGPDITLARNDSKPVPLTIEMFNTAQNQDACKRAVIAMRFTATAAGR